jgi:hypothetical protein
LRPVAAEFNGVKPQKVKYLVQKMMQNWMSFASTVGLSTAIAFTLIVPAQAEPLARNQVDYLSPDVVLAGTPSVILSVDTYEGICPDEIRVWQKGRYYEGGYETGAAVDFGAIASGPALFMDSGDRHVIYGAPLNTEYASCTGWVVSDFPQYNIWLQNGHAYLRFDLDALPRDRMSVIRYQSIVAGLPYVQWAIAD